jgi:hypothetical protein
MILDVCRVLSSLSQIEHLYPAVTCCYLLLSAFICVYLWPKNQFPLTRA